MLSGQIPMRRGSLKAIRYGIELEYEKWNGNPFFDDPSRTSLWSMHGDGSLREGGVEFVSAPLAYRNVTSALMQVNKILNGPGKKLVASNRCGLHVHVNVVHLKWEQLGAILMTYAALEPWIFTKFAPTRLNNPFCTPLMFDHMYQTRIRTAFNRNTKDGDETMGRNIFTSCPKYTALNLQPLFRLGTIEFRQIPSTRHVKEIKRWVDFIEEMIRWAIAQDMYRLVDLWEERGNLVPFFESTFKGVQPSKELIDKAYNAIVWMAGDPVITRDMIDWKKALEEALACAE